MNIVSRDVKFYEHKFTLVDSPNNAPHTPPIISNIKCAINILWETSDDDNEGESVSGVDGEIMSSLGIDGDDVMVVQKEENMETKMGMEMRNKISPTKFKDFVTHKLE